MHIVDASAWVEYFLGTKKGARVRSIVRNKKCITAESTIGEIVSWGLKNKQNVPAILATIQRFSLIHEIYLNLWADAAGIRHELRPRRKKFGIMDALLVALQRATKATIVTADTDFRRLPGVILL